MSATTQYTDFSDLYTGLLNAVRADTSIVATENQAKRYINTALLDMHIGFGEKFPWAERRAVVRTQEKYDTGTVAVTQGSTTITGTGTEWNTNNAFSVANMRVGGKITINGGFDVYEITAVASDTSATLNTAFIGDTDTDLSYTYFEDEYALASDFLRPMDFRQFSDALDIRIMDRREFKRAWVRNKTLGKPTFACIVDLPASGNTTPVRKVRFHLAPDTVLLIPYSYVTGNLVVQSNGTEAVSLSGDTDEPIVPLRYRHAIVLHALYHWYRDRKDDNRSKEAKTEYLELLTRMVSDTEYGDNRMRITPYRLPYIRKARSPYRGGGVGRYDINGRFDRIE